MIIARMYMNMRTPRHSQPFRRSSVVLRSLSLLLGFCLLLNAGWAYACPNLQPYYQLELQSTQDSDGAPLSEALETQLAALMGECLESSEFFALYGAAQLNEGKLAESLESLERALLLNPNNGAAQIDYAQALYRRGQLFSALDLNSQILARADTPLDIRLVLLERDTAWRKQTRRYGFQADVLAGFDDNLNGAPDPSQIALTLSGQPVFYPLSDDYRPKSGPYLNASVAGNFVQLAPDHRHNAVAEIRSRTSEHTASDLLQLDTRYAYERPTKDRTWRLTAGLGHLMFGGTSLFTSTTFGAQYQLAERKDCTRQIGAALQYQLYHQQNELTAVESKVAASQHCTITLLGWKSRIGAEIGIVSNSATGDNRPGGDRQGWQGKIDWQFPLYKGVLSSQINFTSTRDDSGYSIVLNNGEKRWLDRTYMLVQYRQMLRPNATILFNLYHQNQSSNIDLFDSLNTTVEAGLSFSF